MGADTELGLPCRLGGMGHHVKVTSKGSVGLPNSQGSSGPDRGDREADGMGSQGGQRGRRNSEAQGASMARAVTRGTSQRQHFLHLGNMHFHRENIIGSSASVSSANSAHLWDSRAHISL